ncbi:MAG: isocitrate lyase/phosphoenolpyruvate mutase family protein [Rhodospirillales bacterium]|jgi:2-methylisocitrate lyase-like PEP mutase family enzyme|nr:isocitrate lyase/phosphoenolpyruvate mutase family protein [Rhodospirillales bacterium]
MSEAFRKLHYGPDILILPNAWDAASARIIAAAGFPAIATTSAGIAFARGYPDGERIGRAEMLRDVACIVGCVDVPVTADLEAGYGPDAEDVAETMRQAIKAGAAGLNLEDSSHDPDQPLFEMGRATERVAAARAAAAAGVPVVINARTDGYILGFERNDELFADTVERANAYRAAGADCIFVPAVIDAGTIGRLAAEIDGPINILAGPGSPPLPELRALGVARVSIGSGLARAAYTVARRAADELLGPGTFTFAEGAISHPDMNRLMERTD